MSNDFDAQILLQVGQRGPLAVRLEVARRLVQRKIFRILILGRREVC